MLGGFSFNAGAPNAPVKGPDAAANGRLGGPPKGVVETRPRKPKPKNEPVDETRERAGQSLRENESDVLDAILEGGELRLKFEVY